MCNRSYAVFSGSNSGTPLSPAVSNDCDTAIMDYSGGFVAPEAREMVIEKIGLSNVRRQLKQKEAYSFSAGVVDLVRAT